MFWLGWGLGAGFAVGAFLVLHWWAFRGTAWWWHR